jgi:hypothetical protein
MASVLAGNGSANFRMIKVAWDSLVWFLVMVRASVLLNFGYSDSVVKSTVQVKSYCGLIPSNNRTSVVS